MPLVALAHSTGTDPNPCYDKKTNKQPIVPQSILNLTQHLATPEQIEFGVFDLPDYARKSVSKLLTFDHLPENNELKHRAIAIVELVQSLDIEFENVMIGGAPFFMSTLEDVLSDYGIAFLYAFSVRQSVDNPDGTKTSVFKHLGFVDIS